MTSAGPIWLTGASGYIGTNLAAHLRESGVSVNTVGRNVPEMVPPPDYDCTAPEAGAQAVPCWIHAAGVASRLGSHSDAAGEAIAFAYRSADDAMSRGIPRLILCSSIYARLHEEGVASPYGEHKCAVEKVFADKFRGELVILRLPPLYGGMRDRSSIAKLAALTATGLPLPLGGARAPRSYLSIDNFVRLIDALMGVVPASPGERRVFEPSDGMPISTRELIDVLAAASGKAVRTFAFPERALRAMAQVAGKGALVDGAFGALEARDGTALRDYCGWRPTRSTAQGVTAAHGRNI